MIIKRLELQGFKSFSEKTKLIFHSGITAIIGPNGTGKSNIVDALLWVLGEKRMKGLRGERSADIIFNGNTKVPPMGMADVSLFLEDKDDELSISHRVFRSKESEYRLNGKQVQDSNTKHMIFKIPEILAFVSKNFTLEPGDIVTTGTPSGVGPIKHGDIVEVEIEGIGILRNPVVEE